MTNILAIVFVTYSLSVLKGISCSLNKQDHKAVMNIKPSENVTSCFEALSSCRQNSSCLSAFKNAKRNCVVRFGMCDATDDDMLKCAHYTNVLKATAFPADPRCDCVRLNLPAKKRIKCFQIYNGVYFNPCFDASTTARNTTKLIMESSAQLESMNVTESTKHMDLTSFAGNNTTPDQDSVLPHEKKNYNLQFTKVSEEDLKMLDEFLADGNTRFKQAISSSKLHYDSAHKPSATKPHSATSKTTSVSNKDYDDSELPTPTRQIAYLSHKSKKLSVWEISVIGVGCLVFSSACAGAFAYFKCREKSVKPKPTKYFAPNRTKGSFSIAL